MRTAPRLLRIAALGVFLVLNGSTVGHAGTLAQANAAKVDLNRATEKQLVDLPGIDPATAKKIIAGRPYASLSDLSRAGVSKAAIEKISSMVMVSGGAGTVAPMAPVAPNAPAPPAPSRTYAPVGTASAGQSTTAANSATLAQTPPSPGMVWVNLESKSYYTVGDRHFGKTKHGKWMTEQDAVAAGYRPAKTASKKAGT